MDWLTDWLIDNPHPTRNGWQLLLYSILEGSASSRGWTEQHCILNYFPKHNCERFIFLPLSCRLCFRDAFDSKKGFLWSKGHSLDCEESSFFELLDVRGTDAIRLTQTQTQIWWINITNRQLKMKAGADFKTVKWELRTFDQPHSDYYLAEQFVWFCHTDRLAKMALRHRITIQHPNPRFQFLCDMWPLPSSCIWWSAFWHDCALLIHAR